MFIIRTVRIDEPQNQAARVPNPASPLTSYVISGKLFNLSMLSQGNTVVIIIPTS